MDLFWLSEALFILAGLLGLVLMVHVRTSRRGCSTGAYDWLSAALVAYVFVSIPIDQLGYDYDAQDNAYWMRVAAFGLVVFPGLLVRSIHALCRVSDWTLRLSDSLTILLGAGVVLMPTFPGGRAPETSIVYEVVVFGAVLEMLVASIICVRTLLRTSSGQPRVVRVRAALLNIAQVSFLVTFVVWASVPGEASSLVGNFMLCVVGGLLIAALVWPRRVMQVLDVGPHDRWKAFGTLMASIDVRSDLERILDDVTGTWGLAGVAVADRERGIVEVRGKVPLHSDASRSMREDRFGSESTEITVWSTPLSLPFVQGDRAYFALLATMIEFALDRASTVEHHAAAAQSLAAANARLVEADELKDRFVSLVSHELRTPLTSIIGLARTAEERWDEVDEAQIREFLRIIADQGERLARIIENLLVTSRIEGNAIGGSRELVELEAAARTAVVDAGLALDEVDVDVEEAAASFETDPQALHEILVNLLANADKYGAPPVTIRGTRVGRHVEVAVCDAGPGVEPDLRDRLFERFTRGGQLAKSGTGLGLSIVRELAGALGGEAGFRPRSPGSEFWIRTPATAAGSASDG